jgi:hypothetical protein
MESMVLGHLSGATRLNTGTMTDLPTLAATLLANFCTIRFPASVDRSAQSTPSLSDWWTTAKARRAERLAVNAYRHQMRRQLIEHCHRRFLDHLEPDPEGGWRLHFFLADDAAMSLLIEASVGECGPGDPVVFDPKEFVAESLGGLKGIASDFE